MTRVGDWLPLGLGAKCILSFSPFELDQIDLVITSLLKGTTQEK